MIFALMNCLLLWRLITLEQELCTGIYGSGWLNKPTIKHFKVAHAFLLLAGLVWHCSIHNLWEQQMRCENREINSTRTFYDNIARQNDKPYSKDGILILPNIVPVCAGIYLNTPVHSFSLIQTVLRMHRYAWLADFRTNCVHHMAPFSEPYFGLLHWNAIHHHQHRWFSPKHTHPHELNNQSLFNPKTTRKILES